VIHIYGNFGIEALFPPSMIQLFCFANKWFVLSKIRSWN